MLLLSLLRRTKSLTCRSLSDVLRARLSPISELFYQDSAPRGDPDSSLHEYQVMPQEIEKCACSPRSIGFIIASVVAEKMPQFCRCF